MKTWLIPVMALSLLVAPVQPWAVAQTVPAAPLVLAQSPAAEGGAVATPAQDFVAVLDLDALGGVSKDEALIITSRLRANLLKTGKYRILERAKMSEILKEQGFQESALCDTTACSVELGRLLAVNRILSGSVSRIGNTYTLSIRLLDVEKGTVIKEEFEDCSVCELDAVLIRLTASLAVKMAGQQGDVNLQGSNTRSSKSGTLNLTTTPSGVSVYLNAQPKGITPLKLDLPPGKHQLTLEGNGFTPQTFDIDLAAGEILNKHVNITSLKDSEIERYKSFKREERNPWLAGGLSLIGFQLGYMIQGEWGWWALTLGSQIALIGSGVASNNPGLLYSGVAVQLFGVIHSPIIANSKNEELRKKYGLTEADIKRIEASGQVVFFSQPPAQDGFYLMGGEQNNASLGLGYRHGF